MADLSSTLAAVPPGCHLDSGCGFPAPGTEIFVYPALAEFQLFGIDFVINKPVVLMFMCALVVIVFFGFAFAKPKMVPGKLQSIGELSYTFVRDQIGRETIGKNADKYVAFLFSLFFFIWLMNFLEILPLAQLPPTAYFAIPATLSLIVWVVYMFLGMKHQGPIKFYTNMMFPPGVPAWVLVLLAPIELLSNVIIRPFTLAIRLMANMFAGHMLITIFIVASIYLFSPSVIGLVGSIGSGVMVLVMTVFEFGIGALQAYIFTLLAASYIAGSLSHEH